MVKATMHSVLNTDRNIFMRLHGSVEEVVTMCLVYKIWHLCVHPPPPPPPHTHTHTGRVSRTSKRFGYLGANVNKCG